MADEGSTKKQQNLRDCSLPEEKFETGRRFTQRIPLAARIIAMRYHAQLDGSTRLPLTAEVLREYWEQGKITAQTLLRQENEQGWTRARNLALELGFQTMREH